MMKKRISNHLEGVTIKGDYTGGDVIVNGCMPKANKNTEKKSDKTVFLSYNWHDGEIADRIDRHLSINCGITVMRDVRDIGTWKSIREFMKSIRQQDYAVLIVSDLYLKSKNCMFEVTEVMKEQKYMDRIFPAVVERSIYDPLVRVEYIKHWQRECQKLESAIKGLHPADIVELAEELRRYQRIASSISEFLDMVSDRNQPDLQDIEVQIEKAVLKN